MQLMLLLPTLLTVIYIVFTMNQEIYEKYLKFVKVDILFILMALSWILFGSYNYIGHEESIYITSIAAFLLIMQQIVSLVSRTGETDKSDTKRICKPLPKEWVSSAETTNDTNTAETDNTPQELFSDPLLNQTGVVTKIINQKNYVGKFVSGEKKDMDVLVYCEEPLREGDKFVTTMIVEGHIVAQRLS